jgi:hypothetical protein
MPRGPGLASGGGRRGRGACHAGHCSEDARLAEAAYLKQLGYPVALDTGGRLADGYGVQDQPWYVLTSASGRIVWQHDGWLPVPGP